MRLLLPLDVVETVGRDVDLFIVKYYCRSAVFLSAFAMMLETLGLGH